MSDLLFKERQYLKELEVRREKLLNIQKLLLIKAKNDVEELKYSLSIKYDEYMFDRLLELTQRIDSAESFYD